MTDFKFSDDQQDIMDSYIDGHNIFITGPGGCGKSFLIKHMYNYAIEREKKIVVTALTGCAAILLQCNAKTIHSWSGIGAFRGCENVLLDKIQTNPYKKKDWKNIEILIIDEVSMMSKEMFELLDCIGKKIRRNSEPFGGIQVIMCGDFYQLPPIGDKDNPDSQAFCFESPLWNTSFDFQYLLDKSFRQKDETYIHILNSIRQGSLPKSYYNILKQCVDKPFHTDCGVEPVQLLPIKKKVDAINYEKLDSLQGELIEYPFEIDFKKDVFINDVKNIEYAKKKYCIEKAKMKNKKVNNQTNTMTQYFQKNDEVKDASGMVTKNINWLVELPPKSKIDKEAQYLMNNTMFVPNLKLKIGAQVMCTSNIDLERGICNGSTGIIVDFVGYDKNPKVKFNNGLLYTFVDKHTIPSETISGLSIKQYPIILAWAITIHKSQGATLSSAIIDAGSSVFAEGQTYVALSRVKNLDGLWLHSFNPTKIRVNKKVKEFYEKFYDFETDEEE